MFEDGRPIYHQIADRIRDEILSGTLDGDMKLMSTNEYASFYRINPATAARAFHILLDEGLIYKQRGIGMFVSPDAAERLRARHRERFLADVVDPMVAEARAVGMPLTDIITRIRKLGGVGDREVEDQERRNDDE